MGGSKGGKVPFPPCGYTQSRQSILPLSASWLGCFTRKQDWQTNSSGCLGRTLIEASLRSSVSGTSSSSSSSSPTTSFSLRISSRLASTSSTSTSSSPSPRLAVGTDGFLGRSLLGFLGTPLPATPPAAPATRSVPEPKTCGPRPGVGALGLGLALWPRGGHPSSGDPRRSPAVSRVTAGQVDHDFFGAVPHPVQEDERRGEASPSSPEDHRKRGCSASTEAT